MTLEEMEYRNSALPQLEELLWPALGMSDSMKDSLEGIPEHDLFDLLSSIKVYGCRRVMRG